jgi:hypothetical protein
VQWSNQSYPFFFCSIPPFRRLKFVLEDFVGEPSPLEAFRRALVVGPLGSGKSLLVTRVFEALAPHSFEAVRLRYSQLLVASPSASTSAMYLSPRQRLALLATELLLKQARANMMPSHARRPLLVLEHLEDFVADGPVAAVLFPFGGSEESLLHKLAVAGIFVVATVGESDRALPLVDDLFGHVFRMRRTKLGEIRAADLEDPFDAPSVLLAARRTCAQLEAAVPEMEHQSLLAAKHPAALTLAAVAGIPLHIKDLLLQASRFALAPQPWGMLLSGAPGTGKTRLMSALAGSLEASGTAFFAPALADILRAEIGASEGQLAAVFAAARASQPAVIFFDEIDALFPEQGHGSVDLTEAIVSEFDQLATDALLEGFPRILVLSATNFPERVSHRLVQAGRFEVHLILGLPGRTERRELLLAEVAGAVEDELMDRLIDATEGMTPAQLSLLASTARTRLRDRQGSGNAYIFEDFIGQ